MAFFEVLRLARTNSGLSQEAMSIKCGISRSHYSNIETGDRLPPVNKLERFADVLKIPADERQAFIEAGWAAHSHADLVSDFRERGQEIERLRQQVEFFSRVIATPDQTTDAEIRAEAQELDKAELVEVVVTVKRANRKLLIRAWPKRQHD